MKHIYIIIILITFLGNSLAGLIEVSDRQDSMTITYEIRDKLVYQVVKHPTGVNCLYNAIDLKAHETSLTLQISELQVELVSIKAQIKSLSDKQIEITESE